MHEDLISVIIPVYNVETYLPRCIESVLAQSYKNLEILLIDDGSKDTSGQVCEKYALTDSRIRVFHKPNGGLSSARNYGLARATGSWISLVDSDDWIASSFIEDLYDKAISEHADISVCDWYFAYSDKKEEECVCFSPSKDKAETFASLVQDGYHVVWNKLYKKDLFDRNELAFPEHIQRYCEDSWFSFRAFYYAEKVVKVEKPLYYYFLDNQSSITKTAQSDKARSIRVMAYQDSLDFFKNAGASTAFTKPLYWRIILEKTWLVLHEDCFHEFHESFREANQFIWDNPLLSWKMKLQVWLVAHRLYLPARLFLKLSPSKQ